MYKWIPLPHFLLCLKRKTTPKWPLHGLLKFFLPIFLPIDASDGSSWVAPAGTLAFLQSDPRD